MPISVKEAIDGDTANKRVLRVRYNYGGYDDRLAQPNSEAGRVLMLASVQPPSGKELKMLSEGERTSDVRTMISNKPVRTPDEKAQVAGDEVIFDSITWKVVKVLPWSAYGQTTSLIARVQ